MITPLDISNSILFVPIGFIMLGLWALIALAATSDYVVVDDDVMEDAYAEMDELKGLGLVITFMIFRLICNACGIYGALTYNTKFVFVSLIAYSLEFILSLFNFGLVGLLVAGCFAYPHVFFIREVQVGIMTPENYSNEKHSCCCV